MQSKSVGFVQPNFQQGPQVAGIGRFVDSRDIVAPHPVVGEPVFRPQVEAKQRACRRHAVACQRDALPWPVEIDGGGDGTTSVGHAVTGGEPVGGRGGGR